MAVLDPVAPRTGGPTLLDAAMAPIFQARRGWWLLVGLLAVPVAVGLVAYVVQLREGLAVTGLNNQVFWGVYTVDLVTLVGLSYGGALVSAILRLTGASWRGPIVRIAEGSALVTLLVGALFPVIHVGRPERLWEMFLQPQWNSPLLWDMVAILTYLIATVLLFGLPLVADLGIVATRGAASGRRARIYRRLSAGWRGADVQVRVLHRTMTVLAIAIIPLAVMVHTVLAFAFSLTSRPGWHSTIFGPYFVLAAIYSGIATVILATIVYRRVYHLEHWIPQRAIQLLAYLMITVGVAYAYFMFSEITTEGYVGDLSAQHVLYGLILQRYAPLFWTFVVLGLAVPVLLVAVPRTRTVRGIALASGLVVGSLWLKRFLMFVPPMTQPLIAGEPGAYVPSWVEWAITLGAVAAIPLLLAVLFRLVPVLSVHEMEELGAGDPGAAEATHPQVMERSRS